MLHTAAWASSTPFFLYFPIHAAFIAKNSSDVEKSHILYNSIICYRKTLFNKNIFSSHTYIWNVLTYTVESSNWRDSGFPIFNNAARNSKSIKYFTFFYIFPFMLLSLRKIHSAWKNFAYCIIPLSIVAKLFLTKIF